MCTEQQIGEYRFFVGEKEKKDWVIAPIAIRGLGDWMIEKDKG